MRAPFLVIPLAVLAACNRIEEPQHSADPRAHTDPPLTPATQESSSPSGARTCLVPLPAAPPPAATAAASCPPAPEKPPTFGSGTLRFSEAPSKPVLKLEVANDQATHEHGLMYRTVLPEDHGMLFSWPNEQVRAFWMMNTCIPLDMMFIAADRTILGILEEVPVLNRASRSIPCPAAYVLEVNAGYSRRHGIKPGMHVEID